MAPGSRVHSTPEMHGGSPPYGHPVKAVEISPDGRLLLSVCKFNHSMLLAGREVRRHRVKFADGTVRLWRTVDWSSVGVFVEHSIMVTVTRVAFAPDGELLVSGAEDGTVCIWKVPELEA
ncbi:quinon protein alcohol dehydrogenase-like superfamily [Ganoderma leucocontextum]|nr:quinon protein alcohol dehydrogenase-like superfamily [Ganoderma leucocontextum]